MKESVIFIISVLILLLGIPLGKLLRDFAGKEEIPIGQKYFKAILIISIIGIVLSIIFQTTYVAFAFTFILVITRESLQ